MNYTLKQQAMLLAQGVWYERVYVQRFFKEEPYIKKFRP